MLNFRLSWPAGLRSSSPASTSAGDTPTTTPATTATGRQTAIPAGSFPLASSSSSSSIRSITRKDKAHKATGVPASVRYFAIFDPRPPAFKKNKGKGKERAQDDPEQEEEEQPPSTTVLFYSSPSEPTTTQTTIQRKLGLASAIVHFSSELNNVASSTTTTTTSSSWPNADTQHKDLPRWSVTASKTRTLTLRVRPFVYLHVVVDLPRLPRQVKPAATLGKDGKGAAIKWEYVSNGVADEAVFEAMAQAWTSFVDRNGERPTHSEPTIDDGEDDEEEEKYHRALEKFFMPWVLTWDLPSSSFPNQPKLSSTSTTGTIRNNPTTTTKTPSSSLRKSITAAVVGTGSSSSRPSSIHSTKESSRPSSSSASAAALTAALG
ncbi:hypothetical protein A4X09_0g3117 [Tilletia walkeri]|uniref:Uncharacterized protein n=1 Tax=Tilletia walkeri TaxID=117179 RepID=A0A8X7NA54_9BASI|nr:hypothetical protein A4X09_0g3117 [Tilletia walkeri]